MGHGSPARHRFEIVFADGVVERRDFTIEQELTGYAGQPAAADSEERLYVMRLGRCEDTRARNLDDRVSRSERGPARRRGVVLAYQVVYRKD